ncbi:hypothetical protein BDN70DRAFT_916749 [Pholiota conissans]|uniref:Uncharacterized protein n=1 Tax=Pholiota conissans TaxID=109636 RepID=A0A9P6D794_9AGAR|nr:hypothetical protein BDN70DRAFT_916749 [Pholiota conissans]
MGLGARPARPCAKCEPGERGCLDSPPRESAFRGDYVHTLRDEEEDEKGEGKRGGRHALDSDKQRRGQKNVGMHPPGKRTVQSQCSAVEEKQEWGGVVVIMICIWMWRECRSRFELGLDLMEGREPGPSMVWCGPTAKVDVDGDEGGAGIDTYTTVTA